MDGIQSENVCGDEALQMFPAQKESFWGGMEEKFAVTEHDSFLRVARMFAESLELQPGLEISE